MINCSKCDISLNKQKSITGYYCRSCKNEYNKAHQKRRPDIRREADKRFKSKLRNIILLAKDKPCADCGLLFPYYVMDFDHVRGEKKFTLAEAANKHISQKRLKEEIDKCDVVCANCHRIRTHTGTSATESHSRYERDLVLVRVQ